MRIPYFINASLAIALFLFAIYLLVRSCKIIKTRYSRGSIAVYFFFLFLSLGFHTFHYITCVHDYPLEIFEVYMKIYYSDIFTNTFTVLFFAYLLHSVCYRFEMGNNRFHNIVRIVSFLVLALYWILMLVLFTLAMKDRYRRKTTQNLYWAYRVYLGYNMLLSALIIVVMIYYVIQLKKFPQTFENTKAAIFFSIISAFLAETATVIEAYLVLKELYEELAIYSERVNIPVHGIVTCTLDFFTGIMLPLSFNVYLWKDTKNLEIVMLVEEDIDTSDGFENELIASVIEDKLLEYMKHKNSHSEPISTSLGEDLNESID